MRVQFWQEGTWKAPEQATVSVLDLGFLRGMGVFDTLRSYGGLPFSLGAHLQRLWKGSEAIGVPPVFTEDELRSRLIVGLAELPPCPEFRLRIVVTPGARKDVAGLEGDAPPTTVLLLSELVPLPESLHRDGVGVVTFDGWRAMPETKTTDYLVGREGLKKAHEHGANEALYAGGGRVTEGVTSNVVLRFGNRLVTPGSDCLPGITLQAVAGVARSLGLEWEERDVAVAELLEADAVYLTGSIREVLPVVRVDDRAIADGRPDAWAGRLLSGLRALGCAQSQADHERFTRSMSR